MRSNYKRIGDFIELVDERNNNLEIDTLLGLSIDKVFIPSVANTVGTNMKRYKIIRKNQFACSIMQVRRDKKMPVALLKELDEAIISQAYPVFQVKDENELLPDYLMMWMSRSEFDRHACFLAVGGVRGSLEWEDFLDMELPVPSIEKQREIVAEYNAVVNRIQLNERLNQKLEETAQTIYRQWFEEFEFPIPKELAAEMGNPKLEGKPYKSSGGEMVFNEELDKEIPKGWVVKKINEVANLKYGKMLSSSLFTETGYPVYSGYGVRGYYTDYMYEEPQILVLCRGVSGTGEVRLSPKYSYITNLSIVVEINESQVAKGFYYYYLKNDNLRKLDSGSAQSQITIGDLSNYYTLIPAKSIQDRFNIHAKSIYNFKITFSNSTKTFQSFEKILLSKISKIKINTEAKEIL